MLGGNRFPQATVDPQVFHLEVTSDQRCHQATAMLPKNNALPLVIPTDKTTQGRQQTRVGTFLGLN